MFSIVKQRQRLSQEMSQRLSLTWEAIKPPTSPNWRPRHDPRILPMDDPKWILTWARVESIIDYEFHDPEILREAMYPIQSGWARITGGSHDRIFEEGNKKLAHRGDTVLKTMAVDTWFWKMEKAQHLHGELQLFHTNDIMNGHAQDRGLSAIIQMWFRNGKIEGKKTEATTLEAIIGAVWFDSGKDSNVIRKLLDLLLGTELVRDHENHISRMLLDIGSA